MRSPFRVVHRSRLSPYQNLYVSSAGSDAALGSAGAPFASPGKAVSVVEPGGTINITGTHTMTPSSTLGGAKRGLQIAASKSGLSYAPITMQRWAGQSVPVLQPGSLTDGFDRFGVDFLASWWRFREVDFRGASQGGVTDISALGFVLNGGSNNIWDRCRFYENQGSGFHGYGDSRSNLWTACDFFDNYDPNTSPGGDNADGFALKYLPSTATGNVVEYCRMWDNSDDGADFWRSLAVITFRNNWTFHNGYIPNTNTSVGNGNGIKCGGNGEGPATAHLVHNNLSFLNLSWGVDTNAMGGAGAKLWNNSFISNVGGQVQIDSIAHELKNCILYGTQNSAHIDGTTVLATNATNSGVPTTGTVGTLTSGDFVSLDSAGSDGARGVDGSLPVLDFARLAVGSDMRNAGTNLGLPYLGTAPDLGCYDAA